MKKYANWNIHISAVRTTFRLHTQTRNVMLVDVRSDVHNCLWYNDWLLVFSEVCLLFSCLIFCGLAWGPPGARGPRFIEPPEPPVATPLPIWKQENWAIPKMTARCAQYMSALKIVCKRKNRVDDCVRISTLFTLWILYGYHYSKYRQFVYTRLLHCRPLISM